MVAGLSGVFVLLLEILGGPLAMVVYLLATLSVLNRGRTLQNVAISLCLPLALFLLFDRWLNASIPHGCPRAAVVSRGAVSIAPGPERVGPGRRWTCSPISGSGCRSR